MPVVHKPNFSVAYSRANEILATSTVISSFPYSPFDLVKEQMGIPCRSFQMALSKYGLDVRALGSESAVVTELGGRYIIFYDKEKPEGHIKFSILHELGHPVNGHDLSTNDSVLYQKYEVETNYFAAQLLMPEQIIREMQKRRKAITVSFLSSVFGVSTTAAQKRIDTLAKTNAEWRNRQEKEFDDIILFRHKAFLDSVCPPRTFYNYEDEYELQRQRDNWY